MLPLSVKKLFNITGKSSVVESTFGKVTGENYKGIKKLKGHDMVYEKNKENFRGFRVFNFALYFVTGISDFHKITAVSLKSEILKAPPKIKTYRNYKTFHEIGFNEDLKPKLNSIEKLD